MQAFRLKPMDGKIKYKDFEVEWPEDKNLPRDYVCECGRVVNAVEGYRCDICGRQIVFVLTK